MIVCVAGASGFLGARIAARLAEEGHSVVCAARSPPHARHCQRWLALDFSNPDPARWARELAGVDVLVNAIGILRERRTQTFEALHIRGPWALFDAAVTARVPRIIQISALGAAADAPADYHRSKHAADFYLGTLPVDWMIVRPSLVYGAGGTSAAMFETLASLPVIPLPGGGHQRVQPVHVHDLVDAVASLAVKPLPSDRVLPVVGPRELTLRGFLEALRSGLGLPRARTLGIPEWMVRTAASVGEQLPGMLLDRETLGMLERGNTGSPEGLTTVLGHPPRDVEQFVSPAEQSARRLQAALRWIEPLLRFGIAIMWLTAGIVSLGLYPVEASERLLVQIGVPESLAPLALRGAAILDIALGLLTLWPRAPRWLWSAQIALVLAYTAIITWKLPALWPRASRWLWSAQIVLVLAYTAIITWKLPALWLEPFGPVVKNLPILALLVLMRELRIRR